MTDHDDFYADIHAGHACKGPVLGGAMREGAAICW